MSVHEITAHPLALCLLAPLAAAIAHLLVDAAGVWLRLAAAGIRTIPWSPSPRAGRTRTEDSARVRRAGGVGVSTRSEPQGLAGETMKRPSMVLVVAALFALTGEAGADHSATREYSIAGPGTQSSALEGFEIGGVRFAPDVETPGAVVVDDASGGPVGFLVCQDPNADADCGGDGEPRLFSCGSLADLSQSTVSFDASLETTVLVFAAHEDCPGAVGISGTVTMTYVRPANDALRSAVEIGDLPYTTHTSSAGATLQEREPAPSCGTVDATVWYRFTPPVDMAVAANTYESDYPTVVAVYAGTRFRDLHEIGCANGNFDLTRLITDLEAGETYLFQIGDEGSGGGPLVFTLETAHPPANDDFASAARIDASPYFASLDTTDASSETDEPEPSCAPIGATVWYRIRTVGETTLEIDTSGSDFDTVIGVYRARRRRTGRVADDLAEVTCNDDADSGLSSATTFVASAGKTYYVQIGGYEGSVMVTPPFGALAVRVEASSP
jgi:hypothetical protein